MWVKNFTGPGHNMPKNIVQDINGNNYIVGNFTNVVTQDTLFVTSSGGQDIFLSKYNAIGQIQWLKQIGGTLMQSAVDIVLSKDKLGFYVLFYSTGTASVEGNNLTSTGGYDIYIAKYLFDGTLS